MGNKHIQTSSQIIQQMDSQDFSIKSTIKLPFPNDPPYIVRCKKCGKPYTIPMGAYLKVEKIICKCGTHVMTMAPNSYVPPTRNKAEIITDDLDIIINPEP